MKKIYVIGDVHGCLYTLKKLLARLEANAEIILVGDLCDKGKHSKELIEFVMQKGYLCVKGNHEHLMQKYLYDAVVNAKHSPWSEDYRYGGIATYESYKDDLESMRRHLAWLDSLPIYLQRERYFITHGYALPYYEHRENPEYYNDFLLSRYEEGMDVPSSEVINIFGHCVFDEVIAHENFYAIDTGCAYGKKLTALELGSMKIIQEDMDKRDSNYEIKELLLEHLELFNYGHNAALLAAHIDERFVAFDVVSTEVAAFMVESFGEEGRSEIPKMLKKKQLFIKQAKKFVKVDGGW
jgi:serine/threonine protein phosphatase 1